VLFVVVEDGEVGGGVAVEDGEVGGHGWFRLQSVKIKKVRFFRMLQI